MQEPECELVVAGRVSGSIDSFALVDADDKQLFALLINDAVIADSHLQRTFLSFYRVAFLRKWFFFEPCNAFQ